MFNLMNQSFLVGNNIVYLTDTVKTNIQQEVVLI